MRSLVALLLLFSLSLGIGLWIEYAPNKAGVVIEQKLRAKELLASGNPREAALLASEYLEEQTKQTADREWVGIGVQAFSDAPDPYRLLALWRLFPEEVLENEKACLMIAKIAAFANDQSTYEQVQAFWETKKTEPEQWRLVEADRLIVLKQTEKAQELLEQMNFSGVNETERKIRLARLALKKDAAEAWRILSSAKKQTPDYPDLYLWSARVAEYAADLSAAQKEYLSAVRLRPDDPSVYDHLGEFYRRYQQYPLAVQAWVSGVKESHDPILWRKVLFWRKVAYPIALEEKEVNSSSSMLNYLANLSEGVFWDQEKWRDVEEKQVLFQKRQEVYWLAILDALQQKEEEKALALMEKKPFSHHSWHADLELQLYRVLLYKVYGSFPHPSDPKSLVKAAKIYQKRGTRHQLFDEMDALVKGEGTTEQLSYLLDSNEIYSALFLASGWYQAALNLRDRAVYGERYPSWLAFGITQALRQNKGEESALSFALQQPKSSALMLLIAQMQAQTGAKQAALQNLEALYASKDRNIQKKAIWLSANLLLIDQRFAEAKQRILIEPSIAETLSARELLARIAMLEGDIETADRLYVLLEGESSEAKSYLAHRAYQLKQWERAKLLTEQLLVENPSHPVLHQNLKRIESAMQR